jgi:hypothetical protein
MRLKGGPAPREGVGVGELVALAAAGLLKAALQLPAPPSLTATSLDEELLVLLLRLELPSQQFILLRVLVLARHFSVRPATTPAPGEPGTAVLHSTDPDSVLFLPLLLHPARL